MHPPEAAFYGWQHQFPPASLFSFLDEAAKQCTCARNVPFFKPLQTLLLHQEHVLSTTPASLAAPVTAAHSLPLKRRRACHHWCARSERGGDHCGPSRRPLSCRCCHGEDRRCRRRVRSQTTMSTGEPSRGPDNSADIYAYHPWTVPYRNTWSTSPALASI